MGDGTAYSSSSVDTSTGAGPVATPVVLVVPPGVLVAGSPAPVPDAADEPESLQDPATRTRTTTIEAMTPIDRRCSRSDRSSRIDRDSRTVDLQGDLPVTFCSS